MDPRRVRQRRRADPQPGRVEPLQLCDPRRARAARGAGSRGSSLEHRGARGVAPPQRDRGCRRASCDRQGPRRLPRGPRVPRRQGGRMSTRLEALSERLDAPLLITDLTNIFYLTGFDASNAALYVEPGGAATLYTDFRYAESARDVGGVELEVTKRVLLADVGGRLQGKVQFEADALP